MSWPPPLSTPRCPLCGGADEHHKLSCPRRPGGGYQAIPVSWVVPAAMIEPQTSGLGPALEDVRAFNAKFPERWRPRVIDARARMIEEEAAELLVELRRDEQVRHEIAHEALDLVYVALGALVEAGVSAEEAEAAWREIHRANMAKVVPEDGGKARKPEGWVAPDVKGAMSRAAGAARQADRLGGLPTWEDFSK